MARSQKLSQDDESSSTDRLLRVVIALLLRQLGDGSFSLKQQIEILSDLGMGPTEIGKTLGRTTTHVTKELAGLRKKGRSGTKGEPYRG
jgi:hypothetical protein